MAVILRYSAEFLACYHVAKMIFFVLLWEPLFCGAPVRLNMLNVPKSASGVLGYSPFYMLS